MDDATPWIDAQRARWARYRSRERIDLSADENFAIGGLAAHVDQLSARVLLLPSDPVEDAVPLDQVTLTWMRERRVLPFGGGLHTWGSRERGASSAIVLFDQYRDDQGWARYLALHRHGGLEAGESRMSHSMRDGVKVFALRPLVGLIWTIAALQEEAVNRWSLQPPFELTVALRQTQGATLGSFAQGWAEPGRGLYEYGLCIEDNILLRFEITDAIDPQDLALEAGDRLELAFGTFNRRHLGRMGDYEGRFDPRF